MRAMKVWLSRHSGTCVLRLAAVAVVLATSQAQAAPPAVELGQGRTERSVFSRNDHVLIARSIAEHASRVTVILAVEPSQTQRLADQLRSTGSSVRYEADELGYLRAVVPVARLSYVQGLAGIDLAN